MRSLSSLTIVAVLVRRTDGVTTGFRSERLLTMGLYRPVDRTSHRPGEDVGRVVAARADVLVRSVRNMGW